jgi:hypothetical protein
MIEPRSNVIAVHRLSQNSNRNVDKTTRLDDAEATCMHRLISIKNVAVLPKMPSAAVDHRAAGESGFRSLQHVVPEN